MSDEKRKKNLGTYAVIMVLATIFVIIIAAMADNREDLFESQISEQTQINVGIQDQIVRLEDENYQLREEQEKLHATLSGLEKSDAFYRSLSQVYALALEGKPEEASEIILGIDPSALAEEEKAALDLMKKQLDLPLQE